jgi:hypothetical protein
MLDSHVNEATEAGGWSRAESHLVAAHLSGKYRLVTSDLYLAEHLVCRRQPVQEHHLPSEIGQPVRAIYLGDKPRALREGQRAGRAPAASGAGVEQPAIGETALEEKRRVRGDVLCRGLLRCDAHQAGCDIRVDVESGRRVTVIAGQLQVGDVERVANGGAA